jgi:hypothetical protein
MRVFVYEYTCGGGLENRPGLHVLRAEGWAMLSALLYDFRRVPGVETFTLLDEPCDPALQNRADRRLHEGDAATAFRQLARQADYTLVIAPEFDNLLYERCCWVEVAGGRLLGPSPGAVKLTGDKLALGRHLRDRGIPTPQCWTPASGPERPSVTFPLVWKPRHGAGSQATFLIARPDDLPACPGWARAEGWEGEAILQPFVPGQAASVAFLVGAGHQVALLPASQDLSEDGRFRYRGGTIPLSPELAERAVGLARRALATVPGLRGYVGVDVVLGAEDDGSQDWVIEINPRLTTSYVGLRALASTNLAEALLRIVTGEEVPRLTWRAGPLRFQADGHVTDGRSPS